MKREEVLTAAKKIICGDRNTQYGEPENSFKTIADFWAVYLGCPVYASDVAAMMALLKIARISDNPEKADSWIDLAGYAACGAECADGHGGA